MTIYRQSGADSAGTVAIFAANSAPYGWLKANGAEVSRTGYAALFAAIGTLYGVGDGATTFNLPDLRGEFIRGFDDGRGVDAARVFGSAQAGEVASHVHTVDGITSGGGGPIAGFSWSSGVGAEAESDHDSKATGGAETRPRNVALLACIKY